MKKLVVILFGLLLVPAIAWADACTTDADCTPCGVCVNNECAGTGLVICEASTDCDAGFYCEVNATDPCANACLPLEAGICLTDGDCDAGECWLDAGVDYGQCFVPCTTDDECGECQICEGGACAGEAGLPCQANVDCADSEYCALGADPCLNECLAIPDDACTNDAQCEAGEECVMLPDGSGLGGCVAIACTTDDECGVCSVCEDGACISQDNMDCETNEDCLPGDYCMVDADDACVTTCEMLDEGACGKDLDCGSAYECEFIEVDDEFGVCIEADCMTDEECGPCGTCVIVDGATAGTCVAEGVVACESSWDCADGEYCDIHLGADCLNECKVLEEGMCLWSEDCPEGKICHYMDNGQDVGECGDPECVEDVDCAGCLMCWDGECWGDLDPLCTTDADCDTDAGEYCMMDAEDPCMNICWVDVIDCDEDADCPDGQICDLDFGECWEPECFEDVDCADDEVCDMGFCWEIECTTDDDCAEGEVCFEGFCGEIVPDCETDDDCDEGFVCIDTICVEDIAPCVEDADCDEGFVCTDGECVEDVVEPDCVEDADCEEGFVCVDEVCVEDVVEPDCVEDADCAEGEVCTDGECVKEIVEPDCAADADCAEGEVCTDGECVAEPVTGCEADADCAEGEVCTDSKCVAGPVTGCEADADCEEGFVCTDGACVADEDDGGGGGGGCSVDTGARGPLSYTILVLLGLAALLRRRLLA
jgi:MYXO-CTERM domain-containing protein